MKVVSQQETKLAQKIRPWGRGQLSKCDQNNLFLLKMSLIILVSGGLSYIMGGLILSTCDHYLGSFKIVFSYPEETFLGQLLLL